MNNSLLAQAHKALKGDLSTTYQFTDVDKYVFWEDAGSRYICSKYRDSFSSVQYICTVSEFNTEVDYIASNMGRATQTYAEYKKVYAACDRLSKLGNNKPVFTQAMSDANELPQVGMECLVSNRKVDNSTYEKATILFIGKFVVVYNSESCTERVGDMDSTGYMSFKPLTPPIELIDGKAYQFDYRNIETCGVYSKDHNLLYSADSIIDISDCTNIQPLTVEVK